MAFRRFPGLHGLPVIAAVAGILAACSLGPSPAPTSGLQPTEPPRNQSLPEAPVASADERQAAPLALPETSPPATDPPPISPLALAMAQAGSHYEQGIQALQSGNTDQAQWEFDAALETLMDTGPSPPVLPPLVGVDRSPPISVRGWLSPPVQPPQ